MRKLATMVVGMAVLCGMTAFAQTPQPPMAQHEHILYAANEMEMLHIALMEGKHDPATLKLVHKALEDRGEMLHAEIERLQKQRAVAIAMEKGNEEELKEAREALKGSHELVVTKAKAFNADCKAVREHLKLKVGEGQEVPIK
jgi:hypothetical protein